MKAIIFIAHGSKKEKSNQEFRDLVEEIKKTNSKKYEIIETAFLEFVKPSIEEIIERIYLKGSTEITLYPYFLNSGKHVTNDIPDIVNNLKSIYPNIKFSILPHFGLSDKISFIISKEI